MFALTVSAIAYASALATGPSLLNDPDHYSHIAVGRWMLAHRSVPSVDIFSHSVPGARWVAHEWLAEVASALDYAQFGWAGLMTAAALCFAAALGILAYVLSRWLDTVAVVVAVVGAWAMSFPHLLARPHIAILPLLVLWTGRLAIAAEEGRPPRLWWTFLIVLWANLHGSFLLGPILGAMFAGEAIFDAAGPQAAWARLRQWAPFLVVSGVACLLTPLGFDGVLHPFELMRESYILSWTHEFQSPNFQQPQPLEAWLLLGLLGSLFLGLRLPVTRIAMVLVFIHMALVHQRHGVILGLVVPLIVAQPIASQLPVLPRPARAWQRGSLVVGALLAITASLWALPRAHVPAYLHPEAAIAAAQRAGASGPVLNDFNFGGYLMFIGVPTFIDGRADIYGDAFFRRFHRVDQLPSLLEDYGIEWTLLDPGSRHLPMLDRLLGWQRLYADEFAVVHIRR